MEFEYDAWCGISSIYSCDGRQIGENNTGPELYRENIPTEHKTCRFEGSRNGLPMNLSALRLVMSVWDDVLQLTTLLRNDYLHRRRIQGPRLNLRQAYVLSRLGVALPAYLVRRHDRPVPSLPRLETAFFTLGVTPFVLVHFLMERGASAALEKEPLGADVLYEMADASGALISFSSGKACAGSKKHILEFLDVMINGAYKKALTSIESRRALDLIGDMERFYAYVYASSRLELMLKLARRLCAHALFALRAEPNLLNAGEQDLLRGILSVSYYHRPRPVDDSTAAACIVKVALALLDELDAPEIRHALAGARLINADNAPCAPTGGLAGWNMRQSAARQIRQTVEVMYPHCQREFVASHEALGRFETRRITLEVFYARCGGPGLQPLLKLLECATPAHRSQQVHA